MIEIQHSTEPTKAADRTASRSRRFGRQEQAISNALMIAFVVMLKVLANGAA